jgi:superoxide dismutase, Fe-Mn family
MLPTRRGTLAGTAALALATVVPWRSAVAAPIEKVPLPFDPTRLPGLSEKLLRSHWENNYGGAVANLGKVRAELASVGKDTPPFVVAGLMERELTFRNSMQLHELYFGNLGGSGGPQGEVASRLGTAFGSLARFEELFRLACSGLYGGSGWVILHRDLRTDELRLAWSGHHTQTVAMGVPVLVCDLYEHAYALDFGSAAARYVDAYWANVDWEVVSGRLDRADRMARS